MIVEAMGSIHPWRPGRRGGPCAHVPPPRFPPRTATLFGRSHRRHRAERRTLMRIQSFPPSPLRISIRTFSGAIDATSPACSSFHRSNSASPWSRGIAFTMSRQTPFSSAVNGVLRTTRRRSTAAASKSSHGARASGAGTSIVAANVATAGTVYGIEMPREPRSLRVFQVNRRRCIPAGVGHGVRRPRVVARSCGIGRLMRRRRFDAYQEDIALNQSDDRKVNPRWPPIDNSRKYLCRFVQRHQLVPHDPRSPRQRVYGTPMVEPESNVVPSFRLVACHCFDQRGHVVLQRCWRCHGTSF